MPFVDAPETTFVEVIIVVGLRDESGAGVGGIAVAVDPEPGGEPVRYVETENDTEARFP